MRGIRRTRGLRLLLANGDDANKVRRAICSIACANSRKPSSPSWRICGWILTIIWPREICAWSRCNKKSPAASAAWLELKLLRAFVAICPPCANKVCLCCRLCKLLFVVILSVLHSNGPRQLLVILIFDNADFSSSLKMNLGHKGYSVDTAYDELEGQALCLK